MEQLSWAHLNSIPEPAWKEALICLFHPRTPTSLRNPCNPALMCTSMWSSRKRTSLKWPKASHHRLGSGLWSSNQQKWWVLRPEECHLRIKVRSRRCFRSNCRSLRSCNNLSPPKSLISFRRSQFLLFNSRDVGFLPLPISNPRWCLLNNHIGRRKKVRKNLLSASKCVFQMIVEGVTTRRGA